MSDLIMHELSSPHCHGYSADYLDVPPVSADKVGEVAALDGDHLSGRHAPCSSKLHPRVLRARVGGAGVLATPTVRDVRFNWR